MDWPFGLYGAGMHDWLMNELELGARVAYALDAENNVWPPRLHFLELEIESWHRMMNGETDY